MPSQPSGLPPHVRRHGASGFRAVLRINGRRHYGPTFRTPEEAATYVARFLDIREQHRDGPAIVTLQQASARLLDSMRAAGLRDDSLAYYRKYLAVFCRQWGATTPLHEITTREVRLYVLKRERQVSPQTIHGKELQVAGRLFRWAIGERLLHRNPLDGIKAPRFRRPRFEALPRDAVLRIVDQILASGMPQARLHADVVLLLFLTGLRLAEIARLRVCDWRPDRDSGTLFVDGKTDNRYQPVPRALRPTIERLLAGKAPEAPLVGDGKRRLVSRILELWRARLGLPHLSAHVLRHSYATAMVRLGVDAFRLQVLMGHRSITQTQRYFHAAGPDLQDAAERLGGRTPASRGSRAREPGRQAPRAASRPPRGTRRP